MVYFSNLDFLNYGYLTCIHTLQNGPCGSPGARSAYGGPPAGTNGAKCVKFTIGGDGCSASGWDANTVAAAAQQHGWCGVDVDNECTPPMSTTEESAQFQATKNSGVTSMFSILRPDKVIGITVNPDYFATLTFWGAATAILLPIVQLLQEDINSKSLSLLGLP